MTTKRRLRSVPWLLGLVVLALSLACVGMGFKRIEGAAPGSTELVPTSQEAVACFGHVDVKHGVTSLYPVQPGRVAEVLVEENQVVKAGAVLLRLEDTVARLRMQEARVDLEATRTQLVEARKRPRQHEARLAQLQAGLEAMKNRLAAAKHLRDRKEYLYKKVLIEKVDRDVARDQMKEVEALLKAEVEKRAELQLHDPAADVLRAEQEVRAKEARLRQAEESLKECGLRAPSDGKVLRVLAGPGDMLVALPKQPVLLFCPDGPRFIRAEVEQEVAHRVKVGQPAVIKDDGNDPTVWRGRVTALSDWYTQRRSVLQEPMQFNDVRTLECRIALDPGQPALRIGQRVRVLLGRK